MTAPGSRLALVAVATALALAGGASLGSPTASASDPGTTYTVTVGDKGSWTRPDDTPAATHIDKDGTFYYQQAHALYGADDSRAWSFYTGTDFDTAERSDAIGDAADPDEPRDRNDDTTWRCNNSPTGNESTFPPYGSHYA
ncbi:hypothetical protein ACFWR9_22950 [Streptomyces sp. NPDC058534]|uniref:hypothetical protein n=1 Tax=Streptomyces sp. NPDC058534 TaxID=3346541 RepID=UPI003657F290